MDSSNTPQPLWDFALIFYAQPQVAETCLYLQDQHQANVCLLIGLYWLDMQGRALSSADLVDLTDHTRKWTQTIIKPLREMRRTLKQPFENYAQDNLQEQLRSSIKQAELLAEKKLLMEIERWFAKISVASNTQGQNLLEYLKILRLDEIVIDSLLKKIALQ
ncbi:MAG: TIGR02444 family protein [Cellvibrio sp.]